MLLSARACLLAGTVWVRFVTVHREDQDLLRDEARRMGHYQPITTNYTGDPAAPIQHRAGSAASHARRAHHSAATSFMSGSSPVRARFRGRGQGIQGLPCCQTRQARASLRSRALGEMSGSRRQGLARSCSQLAWKLPEASLVLLADIVNVSPFSLCLGGIYLLFMWKDL